MRWEDVYSFLLFGKRGKFMGRSHLVLWYMVWQNKHFISVQFHVLVGLLPTILPGGTWRQSSWANSWEVVRGIQPKFGWVQVEGMAWPRSAPLASGHTKSSVLCLVLWPQLVVLTFQQGLCLDNLNTHLLVLCGVSVDIPHVKLWQHHHHCCNDDESAIFVFFSKTRSCVGFFLMQVFFRHNCG